MPSQRKQRVAGEPSTVELDRALAFLSPREIYLIDELLAEVGDFGEVRLTVKDGRLRFASRTQSFDALKWHRVEVD